MIHKPVLLKESIESLNLKPGMIVIDATLGGGGHSLEVLKKITPDGKLVAVDQDEEAINKFQSKLKGLKLNLKKENTVLVNDNFARLKNILTSLKIHKVGAIVADLGISSDQLENAGRGFSFLKDGPLDMRMDRKQKLTASEIVDTYPEKDLVRILKEYGEERYAGRIARAIRERREIEEIETTKKLVEIVSNAVPEMYKRQKLPRKSRYNIGTRGRHFATKTFQALRIEVNDELNNLKSFLSQAVEVLAPGGRMAVVSFHSGEDRIVKNFFRENARGCILTPEEIIYGRRGTPVLKIITKKPIAPGDEEIKKNPRARSAKLRIAEKL